MPISYSFAIYSRMINDLSWNVWQFYLKESCTCLLNEDGMLFAKYARGNWIKDKVISMFTRTFIQIIPNSEKGTVNNQYVDWMLIVIGRKTVQPFIMFWLIFSYIVRVVTKSRKYKTRYTNLVSMWCGGNNLQFFK